VSITQYRRSTRRTAAALALWLAAVLGAHGAAALQYVVVEGDDAPRWRLDEVSAMPAIEYRRDEAARRPTLSERLREKLRRVPLRPVRIGATPRLPDDPEPGMGIVVRVPF